MVGSRASGSSFIPMRKTFCAHTGAATSSTTATTAVAIRFQLMRSFSLIGSRAPPPRSHEGRHAEQLASDDQPLYVGGAVDRGEHAAVPPAALDTRLHRESPRTHALHRHLTRTDGGLHREQLRHGHVARRATPGIEDGQRVQTEQPSRLQPRGGIREGHLDTLKLADGAPEGYTLLRVLHGDVECLAREADGLDADEHARGFDPAMELVAAGARGTEQIVLRHPHVLEGELGERDVLDPDRIVLAAVPGGYRSL